VYEALRREKRVRRGGSIKNERERDREGERVRERESAREREREEKDKLTDRQYAYI
jgi:hypothetical protein